MSHESATRSYERNRPKGGSPRETEGRALLEAARRMAVAQDAPDDREAMKAAVRLNWKLWTILQAEVCAPDCSLPPEIRTNMINLCNFVDKRIVDVLAEPEPEKLGALININRQIAAGLLTAVEQPGQDSGASSDAVHTILGRQDSSV